MTFRVLLSFLIRFVAIGLPAIGIIYADSTLWNVIWWGIYLAFGYTLVKHEVVTNVCVATMMAQIPLIILIDLRIESQIAWIIASVWAGLAFYTAWQKAIMFASGLNMMQNDPERFASAAQSYHEAVQRLEERKRG